MSLEEVAALLKEQGGRCAICLVDKPGGKGFWHIDHDHKCCLSMVKTCGKCIRGILCHACNTGIGMLREDPVILANAVIYLSKGVIERA